MPRVLILVLSADWEPYRSLEDLQSRSWMKGLPSDLEVLRYRGMGPSGRYHSDRVALGLLARAAPGLRRRWINSVGRSDIPARHSGSLLVVGVPDIWSYINTKMIGAFRYVLENMDFDYLYRTNSSAYLDVQRFRSWIEELPPDRCYAGGVWDFGVSGSGVALSRDLVRAVVDDSNWRFDLMDDVALGQLMKRLSITPINKPRIDLRSPAEARSVLIDGCFQFRCKNKEDRSLDVSTMQAIHDRLQGNYDS